MQKDSEIMVSIRCLTYNHAPYIRNCLEGFVMQKTNFRYEIVIHDDASTDGTADIIREYEKKYPNLFDAIYETENQYSKHDGSLTHIVNSHLKGKYVAYCEGDDYWIDPYKLQKQVDILESDPECSLVYTSFKIYMQDENRFANDFLVDKEGYLYENYFSPIKGVDPGVQTLTVCMRKEVLDNLIPVPKDAFTGDIYIWLCASLIGRFRVIKDITGVYRWAKGSASHILDNAKGNLFLRSHMIMRLSLLESHPIDNIVSINSTKFRYLNYTIKYSLLTNNFEVYKDFHNDKKYFGTFKHRIKLFLYYFFREKHLFSYLSWIYRKIKS